MILAILAFSCQTEKIENDSEKAVQATKTYTFTVQDKEWTAEGDVTRTAYVSGTGLKVTGDELISLFYVNGSGDVVGSNMTVANSPGWKAEPTATAGEYSFTGPSLDGTYKCYAIMPYSYKNLTLLSKTSGNKTVSVGLSNVQYPCSNSFDPHFDFMVGRPFDIGTEATSATVTSFKRLFSPLKIEISGLDSSEKIFVASFKFSQDPEKADNNTLTGLFNISLSENYGETIIAASSDAASGNAITALYPEGLSKGSDGWPVWFIVNPITMFSGTKIDVVVSTADKTYKRTVALPSAAEFKSDKFNELKINIKGDGYSVRDSYTQFFIPAADYSSSFSLTASDGVSRTWKLSNASKTCWDTSAADRDNGSGLPNGLYLYNGRALTLPSVEGEKLTRAVIYAHPNTQSFSASNAIVMTLKDGSTEIAKQYFHQVSSSSYIGLYKRGGFVSFMQPDLSEMTIVGPKSANVTSAITMEMGQLEIGFEVSDGQEYISPWPFSSPGTANVSGTWDGGAKASFKNERTEFTVSEGGYVFSIQAETGIARNSVAGLLFGPETGSYIEFPAIEGMKLSSVEMRSGSASSSGKPAVTETDGTTVLSGGDAFTFKGRGSVHKWTLSGTASNTAYRLTSTTNVRIDIQKLTLTYIPE